MKKSSIPNMPQFFDRYINQVEDIGLIEALEKYPTIGSPEDQAIFMQIGDKRYAPGKWTVKEVLQHITDNERVQAYRALRIARNDKTALPGYDEGLFAENARTSHLSVDYLLEDFEQTRKSNLFLFKSFNEEELLREGNSNNTIISVLALGFVLVGHQIHHLNVLRERYWGLV